MCPEGTGATVEISGDGLKAYNASENTVHINSNTGDIWGKSGGFGGTVDAPYVDIDSKGLAAGAVVRLGRVTTGVEGLYVRLAGFGGWTGQAVW